MKIKHKFSKNLKNKFPILTLGTSNFKKKFIINNKINDISNIIFLAKDYNINAIDTSYQYENEKIIGKVISKQRKKFIIISKFLPLNSSPLSSIKKQFYNSLKNLKTDYLDIYFFHSGNNDEFFNDDIWNFLNKQVANGRIKSLGLSIKHQNIISNKLTQLKNASSYNIKYVSIVNNFLNSGISEKAINYCIKNNLEVIGRKPLSEGLMTGPYDKNFLNNSKNFKSTDKKFIMNACKKIENSLNNFQKKNLTKFSINWSLNNNKVLSNIIGVSSEFQLNSILSFIYKKYKE